MIDTHTKSKMAVSYQWRYSPPVGDSGTQAFKATMLICINKHKR